MSEDAELNPHTCEAHRRDLADLQKRASKRGKTFIDLADRIVNASVKSADIIDDLRDQVKTWDNQCNDTIEGLSLCNKEVARQRSEITSIMDEKASLTRRNHNLIKQIHDEAACTDKERQRADAMKNRNDALISAIEQKDAALAECARKLSEEAGRYDALRSTLISIERDYGDMKDDWARIPHWLKRLFGCGDL